MKRKVYFLMVLCLSLLISSSSANAEFVYSGADNSTELFESIADTFLTIKSGSSIALPYKEIGTIVKKAAAGTPLSTEENTTLALIHPIGSALLVGLEIHGFDGNPSPVIEILQEMTNNISGYELEQLPSSECALFMAQLEELCDLISLDVVFLETNNTASSFPYVAVVSRAVVKEGLEVQPPMLIYNTIPENIVVTIPAVAAFLVDSTRPSAAPTTKSSLLSTQKPSSRTTYQQPKTAHPTATPSSYFVFTSPTSTPPSQDHEITG